MGGGGVDWGSVPEWIGGIGTAGALLIALSVLKGERKAANSAELTWAIDRDSSTWRLVIANIGQAQANGLTVEPDTVPQWIVWSADDFPVDLPRGARIEMLVARSFGDQSRCALTVRWNDRGGAKKQVLHVRV